MKINRSQLKEIIKEVILEDNEYQEFFKKALEKTGKSIPSMSDEEKKSFFDKIDAAWNAKGEKSESSNEGVNDTYDEWRNTKIQAKNIFRMLKQKYNNNISDMKDGLKDIIKSNRTKPDQEKVIWDEFNKYFKIKESKKPQGKRLTEDVNFKLGNYEFDSVSGLVVVNYKGKEVGHGEFFRPHDAYYIHNSSFPRGKYGSPRETPQMRFEDGMATLKYFQQHKITTP